MDKNSFGLATALTALVALPSAGANAAPQLQAAVTPAQSYAELLEPIPNAIERLQLDNARRSYGPARLIRVQDDPSLHRPDAVEVRPDVHHHHVDAVVVPDIHHHHHHDTVVVITRDHHHHHAVAAAPVRHRVVRRTRAVVHPRVRTHVTRVVIVKHHHHHHHHDAVVVIHQDHHHDDQ